MDNTGVKATPEELKELREMAEQASRTPVIAMSSADALGGRDWATMAWKRCQERCHAIALAHGLPEIEGFYGLTNDGEFVRT